MHSLEMGALALVEVCKDTSSKCAAHDGRVFAASLLDHDLPSFIEHTPSRAAQSLFTAQGRPWLQHGCQSLHRSRRHPVVHRRAASTRALHLSSCGHQTNGGTAGAWSVQPPAVSSAQDHTRGNMLHRTSRGIPRSMRIALPTRAAASSRKFRTPRRPLNQDWPRRRRCFASSISEVNGSPCSGGGNMHEALLHYSIHSTFFSHQNKAPPWEVSDGRR